MNLFRADYLAFGDVREQVGRWWDLDRLQSLYQAFLDAAGPAAARPDGRSGGEAFADYVRALTAWRRLPFLDPGLPAELLPDAWNGLRADAAFAALRERLAGPARATCSGSPAGCWRAARPSRDDRVALDLDQGGGVPEPADADRGHGRIVPAGQPPPDRPSLPAVRAVVVRGPRRRRSGWPGARASRPRPAAPPAGWPAPARTARPPCRPTIAPSCAERGLAGQEHQPAAGGHHRVREPGRRGQAGGFTRSSSTWSPPGVHPPSARPSA